MRFFSPKLFILLQLLDSLFTASSFGVKGNLGETAGCNLMLCFPHFWLKVSLMLGK